MSTLPQRIREARARMRLNQAQFADKLNVSQGTVSKWESGQQTPDLPTIIKIAYVADVNAMHLAFHHKEHTLIDKWVSPIRLKGSISSVLSEAIFWEEDEWLDVAMPIPSEWVGLDLFAMIIKDESANVLFQRETIVIFCQMHLEKTDPRDGDVVLISEIDEAVGLRRNVLAVWSKRANQSPILASVTDQAIPAPQTINYRHKIEVLGAGGYDAIGLLGIVVGSISAYHPGRFEQKVVVNSSDEF